eukprot:3818547-Pleurochrysis_carterae.AAC.2
MQQSSCCRAQTILLITAPETTVLLQLVGNKHSTKRQPSAYPVMSHVWSQVVCSFDEVDVVQHGVSRQSSQASPS